MFETVNRFTKCHEYVQSGTFERPTILQCISKLQRTVAYSLNVISARSRRRKKRRRNDRNFIFQMYFAQATLLKLFSFAMSRAHRVAIVFELDAIESSIDVTAIATECIEHRPAFFVVELHGPTSESK